MRRLLRRVVASAMVCGPEADVAAEGVVDDDHPVHEWFGLKAAKVAAVEKRAPS